MQGTIQEKKVTKKVPKLRFPGFSNEWEEKRIGDLLVVERGASPRPIQKYITKVENGIPWIKIGDVPRGSKYIRQTKERITPEGAKLSREVKVNDFVLSNSMSFGRPYISKINGCIHDGWLALKNKDKNNLSDMFLYEILGTENIRKRFLSLAAGSAVKNLKSETVKFAKIYFPSFFEQQKIAGFLGAVDEWIENLRQQKAQLEQYKKGMMQKIFNDPKDLMQRAKQEIVRSDALLIDMTDKLTGRAIEAGIAYALGKKVIVIMKKGTKIKDTTKGISDLVVEYEQIQDIVPEIKDFLNKIKNN